MKSLFLATLVIFLSGILSGSACAQTIQRLFGMTSESGRFYKGSVFSANFNGRNLVEEYGFDLARPGENGCDELFEYNGEFYATAWQGNWGAIIKWNPTTKVFTKLHDFDESCYGPEGNLYFHNGKLYGLTMYSGDQDAGIIYELDLATGVFTKKKETGSLLKGTFLTSHGLSFMNGKFYGVVMNVVSNSEKTIFFEWDPVTNNFTKTLQIPDGTKPGTYRAMVAYNNKLYGIGTSLTNTNGVIFEWDVAANTYTIKKQFAPGSDGASPFHELALKANKFYGSTYKGGANNSGVLFEWDPATNVYTKKIDLPADSPKYGLNSPRMTLFNDKFFSTGIAGPNGEGYIYEWDPASNAFSIRYNFDAQIGSQPKTRLVLWNNKFYSSTYAGGKLSGGIMFAWDPVTGAFDKQFDFNESNGTSALGSLALKGDKLYGMTSKGGSEGQGLIFEFDINTKTYKRMQDLDLAKGGNPESGLTLKDGKFYGMAKNGGANNMGTLFEWDPDNNLFVKKHDFSGADGAMPTGNLTLANGKLYGMTQYGGANNYGVIFEWDPGLDSYTKRIDLSEPEGGLPHGELTMQNGKFYGMTSTGGASHEGVIFEWDPSTNMYTKKIDFDASRGTKPMGGLAWWKNSFHGFTSSGGSNTTGTFFSWDPATNVFTKKANMEFSLGQVLSTPVVNYGKLYSLASFGGIGGGGALLEWEESGNYYQASSSFTPAIGQKPMYTTLTVAKVAARISSSTPGCLTGESLSDGTDVPHTWRPIVDQNGDIVAELNGNENAIQYAFAYVYSYNTSGAPLQDRNGLLYLGRNMTLVWTATNTIPGAPTTARFYIRKEEVDALIEAHNAKPGNIPITGINDLNVFRNNVGDCTPRITATASPIPSTVEPYPGGYVFTFTAENRSTFYVASKNISALPVKLADFTAQEQEGNAVLSWKTVEEVNFSRFEIQRSTDAKNFVTIGNVKSETKGTGGKYRFTDKDLSMQRGSNAYYRLKMIDLDESFAYSSVVQLPLKGLSASVYPNPANKNVQVDLSWETPTTWQILDTNGSTVAFGRAASGKFEVDVRQLNPGFYILQVNSDQLHNNFKLIRE
ncbi:MAG: T9SS type A sorting domain-containing protein [Dyadobacter sp.]|uniref:choice-of-anchor tandem repeat GloVer-containing protein n=1 Tax=Dyadobacter sp. TaxID=1914288 RepID=UPI001B1D29B8|nr:choice-of-anchor tandem repeat GloVer-containing protein [Dyadobacter sp.]MBO9613572.1 T9SS type A sorting domain-containing protein [Dyadobacter sp.]